MSRLWLLGLGLEAIYLLIFTLRFPLHEHYRTLTDIGILTDYDVGAAALYLAGLAGAFLLYIGAWLQARAMPWERARLPVLALGLLHGLTLVLLYPITAIDIFNYIVQAREWVYHGANPLIVPPSAFPDDPFTRFAGGWVDHPSPYGPFWLLLSAPLTLLAGASLLVNLLLFKLLAFASYFGSTLLVSWILAKVRPADRPAGTLFFAWNPLVLLEAVGNGHNDITMMLFVLLAAALALSRFRVLSLAALALSVLVKYTSVLLLPIFVLYLARGVPESTPRLRFLGTAIGLALVPAALAVLPFWAGAETFAGLRHQGTYFNGSIALLLDHFARQLAAGGLPGFPQGPLLLAFGGFYLVQLWRVYRHPGRWLAAAFEIFFVLMFVLPRFFSWYLLWPLPLAAVQAGRGSSWRMLTFSLTALLSVFLFGYVWVWNPAQWSLIDFHLLVVPLTFLPPALVSIWLWTHRPRVQRLPRADRPEDLRRRTAA